MSVGLRGQGLGELGVPGVLTNLSGDFSNRFAETMIPRPNGLLVYTLGHRENTKPRTPFLRGHFCLQPIFGDRLPVSKDAQKRTGEQETAKDLEEEISSGEPVGMRRRKTIAVRHFFGLQTPDGPNG